MTRLSSIFSDSKLLRFNSPEFSMGEITWDIWKRVSDLRELCRDSIYLIEKIIKLNYVINVIKYEWSK